VTFRRIRLTTSTMGAIAALVSALCFGLGAPYTKILSGRIQPTLLAGLLYLGQGLGCTAIWLTCPRARMREASLTRRDVPWLAAAITCGGIIAPILLMTGFSLTPASTASLLINLEVAFTAIIAWFVLHENYSPRTATGMACILGGGLCVSWTGRPEAGGLAGPLCVAAACLGWALDNNLTRRISGGDPLQITGIKGLVAGTVNTSAALLLGAHMPGAADTALAAVVGMISYGMSLLLFVLALRHIGAARSAAYFGLAPFVGAAASLVALRETPSPLFVPACLLMAAGVWLHAGETHGHLHEHPPMEHNHRHYHDAHHQHSHGFPWDPRKPHAHWHKHEYMVHSHPHSPDIHHRHRHGGNTGTEIHTPSPGKG